MKKITLAAAFAAIAMSAGAQYVTTDAGIAPVLEKGKATFDVFALDAQTIAKVRTAGNTVNEYTLNNTNRNLYVWDGTFVAGDAIIPGVDFQFDGYTSLTIGTVGWSGAGYNQLPEGDQINLTHITDQTRLHVAYCTQSTAPSSVAFILLDNSALGAPAKFAVGTAFVDNGVTFPSVGAAPTDEWQAVDISFGDLKKLWPSFNPVNTASWNGNYLSFLAGSQTGANICLDAFYLYTPGGNGIVGADVEKAEILVTNRTINASGAEGIVLYDLTGKTVKAAKGTVMGVENIPAGLYIVKAGNTVRKVVIK